MKKSGPPPLFIHTRQPSTHTKKKQKRGRPSPASSINTRNENKRPLLSSILPRPLLLWRGVVDRIPEVRLPLPLPLLPPVRMRVRVLRPHRGNLRRRGIVLVGRVPHVVRVGGHLPQNPQDVRWGRAPCCSAGAASLLLVFVCGGRRAGVEGEELLVVWVGGWIVSQWIVFASFSI